MRTRRSPRKQERLWRELGGVERVQPKQRLKLVVRTENGVQTLACGHSVALPPCWAGRFPRERHCEQCWSAL